MDTAQTIRQQASADFFTLLRDKDGKVTDADLQPIIDRFVAAGDDPAKVKTWLTFLASQEVVKQEPVQRASSSSIPIIPVARPNLPQRPVRVFSDAPVGVTLPPPPPPPRPPQ